MRRANEEEIEKEYQTSKKKKNGKKSRHETTTKVKTNIKRN
jgi:hypothetical protein